MPVGFRCQSEGCSTCERTRWFAEVRRTVFTFAGIEFPRPMSRMARYGLCSAFGT